MSKKYCNEIIKSAADIRDKKYDVLVVLNNLYIKLRECKEFTEKSIDQNLLITKCVSMDLIKRMTRTNNIIEILLLDYEEYINTLNESLNG